MPSRSAAYRRWNCTCRSPSSAWRPASGAKLSISGGALHTCATDSRVRASRAKRVGQQLGPRRAARAAADERDAVDRGAAVEQRLLAIEERERHALEHRLRQVAAAVVVRQPEERAGRVRVVVRRALARQVGQEQRHAGAGRQRLRLGDELRLAVGMGRAAQPAQRAAGREHHRHLVPGGREGVAERMHRPRRVRRERRVGDEVDARGAERQEGRARLDHADAGRTRRVVAGAAGHDHAGRQAELLCDRGQHAAAGLAAFHQPRHLRAAEVRGGEHGVGPVAALHVEPERAGRIGHVRGGLAGQQQAQVVLGQQHPGDLPEDRRLVRLDPQQLRRREAGHRDVAGDLAAARLAALEFGALGMAAAVVPEDRRTQHAVLRIEQRRAVHVARQAEAADRAERARVGRAQRSDCGDGGGPPVARVLLRPERLRPRDRHRPVRLADDAPGVVDQHRLHLGRAEVDAQVHAGRRSVS